MIKKFVFYSFENLYWIVLFFRELEDGEDDVILDIETSKNVQSSSGKAIKASDAKKKSGRSAKPKNKVTPSLTDDEINVWIEAWAKHENLYNTNHKSYFNRDIWQKSLTSIESTATTALESVISSKKNQKLQGEDVDNTFGKLLVGQLKLIPEGEFKRWLKN